MLDINETTIRMTRGDTGRILLTLTDGDSAYTPADGDQIIFRAKSGSV